MGRSDEQLCSNREGNRWTHMSNHRNGHPELGGEHQQRSAFGRTISAFVSIMGCQRLRHSIMQSND
jgi:hypothetical protein